MNLEYMNITFLYKWYCQYKYVNLKGLWQLIVNFKYDASFPSSKFSPFWKYVNFVSHFFILGSKRIVGNGHSINF
jgi:hypothetical protein